MMQNNLRKLRKEKGLSQIAVQMQTGIEQALISKYENGERVPPTETLMQLADFYGVSMDYIMGRTDRKEINRCSPIWGDRRYFLSEKRKFVRIIWFPNAAKCAKIGAEGRLSARGRRRQDAKRLRLRRLRRRRRACGAPPGFCTVPSQGGTSHGSTPRGSHPPPVPR